VQINLSRESGSESKKISGGCSVMFKPFLKGAEIVPPSLVVTSAQPLKKELSSAGMVRSGVGT